MEDLVPLTPRKLGASLWTRPGRVGPLVPPGPARASPS